MGVDFDPLVLLDIVGTVAFAVSGAAVAWRTGMDWLGVIVLAVVAAVGGGTLRDLVLDLPVSWVERPWPVLLAIIVAVVVIADAHWHPHRVPDSHNLVLVADAAGLASFTAAGTVISLQAGTPGLVAVILGVITGTGGGILRDVLARVTPLVLIGQVYALASVAGATALVLLELGGVGTVVAQWACVAIVFGVRLLAIRYSWSLPRLPQSSPPLTQSGED